MSKFTQPARSVRDIKTLAGKASDLLSPHKVYMRLFALETERHRRLQEREGAMARVAAIDSRCIEIDEEKSRLLATLGIDTLPPEISVPARGGPRTGAAGQAGNASGMPPGVRRRGLPSGAEPTPFDPVKIRY